MSYLSTDALICFAHRGGARRWPENTLVAFQGGWDAGCRWIETDVHMSRDGEIVMFHDHTLDRCTNGTGYVWEKTLAELKELDAGYWFTEDGGRTYPFRGTGVTIPTLREALAWNPEAKLNLEIKQAHPPMLEPLWALIEELGVHDRVLVASAQDPLIRAFRKIARGRVPTSAGQNEIAGFRIAAWARATRWFNWPFQALQVPHWYKGIPVTTARFVRAAHARGIHVHVWTIDDPSEMRALRDKGVDAVMSDLPDVLTATLGEVGRAWQG